jgi:tRNA-specific 2-thiouridylase
MYYTLGQRQGLHIGGIHDRPELPWYVVGKDLENNVLLVAQGEHEMLFSDRLVATDPSWIGVAPAGLDERLACRAKVRYRQADQACSVRRIDTGLEVCFEAPQKAVTPGQFCVFYDGDRCLGGATIDATG